MQRPTTDETSAGAGPPTPASARPSVTRPSEAGPWPPSPPSSRSRSSAGARAADASATSRRHAGAAGRHRLRRAPRAPHGRPSARARASREPILAAHGRSANRERERPRGRARLAARQAHRVHVRFGRQDEGEGQGRSAAPGRAPDGRGSLPLEAARHRRARQDRPRGVRLRRRHEQEGDAEKDAGTLILTEASSKKRASLHLVRGEAALLALAPDGLEVLDTSTDEFAARLRSENHTLKRALTDPHLFSGIGNAYSDEILHHARMSPVKLTSRLTDEEIAHPPRVDPRGAGDVDRSPARALRRASRSRSRRSSPRWPCTASTASRVRAAEGACSAFATPTTR